MSASTMAENPFVGLRPFSSEDSLYYFGRNEQTRALLRQLHEHRFLAVVGASGCGKSSLVRAGLIPILESGFLVQERDMWVIAAMRPGAAPLANLAEALAGVFGEAGERSGEDELAERIRSRGAAAILEALVPELERRQSNLLLLVDQFEELFRFAVRPDEREEAADFVNILLRLAGRAGTAIYVVQTMRSDFIGDCDRFQGLPEAMNQSQYLVPRLTRQQRREAIGGPVRLSGGTTAPRLLDKLLNESIDTRDDLPILQHALMRTWDNWASAGREGPVDVEHLEAVGGMAEALNHHADEALSELDDGDGQLARRLFVTLTETDAGNRKIRRPAYLSEVAGVTGASAERIERVIAPFRDRGRSFLVQWRKPGHDDVLIDISHESLIRQWRRLHGWVEEEAESARIYRRLAETAELHEKGRAALYRGIDLELAVEWRDEAQPTRAWGTRYHAAYESALAFLGKSEKAHEEELVRAARMKRRRMQAAGVVVLLLMALLSTLALYAWDRKRDAEHRKSEAEARHLQANLRVAKSIERDALENLAVAEAPGAAPQDYQRSWLAALVSLNQRELPARASFPDSAGILTRRDLLAGALANLWTSPPAASARRCAVWSPEGVFLVTGSFDGALELWRQPSGNEPPEPVAEAFAPGEGKVYAVAFRADGKLLASGQGTTVRLWDFSDPARPAELLPALTGPKGDVRGLAFSSDGRMLAAASEDGTVRLWELADARAPRELASPGKHEGRVYAVAFSPDGTSLASGSEDKTIRIWDLSGPGGDRSAPRILRGHQDSVGTIAFHPEGKMLASAGRETSIRLWDLSQPEDRAELELIEGAHDETVNHLVFSGDGRTLASASLDGSVGLWDLTVPTRPKKRALLRGHRSFVYSAAFHPSLPLLVSASEDRTLRLWDLTHPSDIQAASGHTQFVNSIAIGPGGGILASGSRDNTVRLWKLSEEGVPRECAPPLEHPDFVYSVAISGDGKLLASGSRDRGIRLFNIEKPAQPVLMATLRGDEKGENGHSSWVLSLAFSADGEALVSGSHDETLRVWNLADPAQPAQASCLRDLGGWVSTVSTSAQGRTLAVGTYGKQVRLYDLAALEAPEMLFESEVLEREVSVVRLSPAGDLLACASFDGRVRLWDLDDPSKPVELAQPAGHSEAVYALAFSSEGTMLATGSQDETIRLWKLATGSLYGMAVLRGHRGAISSVVFSPDGRALYSGSRDYTIRRWDLDGPFADYLREGSDGGMFQLLYDRSFAVMGYRLEGATLVPRDKDDGSEAELRYRAPGSNPLTALLWRAGEP